jgi:hypothetical protein
MRRRSLLAVACSLALPAVLLSASRPAAAGEPKGMWDGLGVGSFVHQKTTSKTSGIAGVPDQPPTVSETKMTLVKVTDDAWIVKIESKMGDDWMPGVEMTYPRKGTPQPKVEDLGEEKVTVDGQELVCRKEKTVIAEATTLSWRSEKYGPVKSETTVAGSTSTWAVTKLSGKTKIGSVELEYRESVSSSKGAGGDSKTTMWTSSDAFPGVIRSEMTSEYPGGMKMSSATETVAFEKK